MMPRNRPDRARRGHGVVRLSAGLANQERQKARNLQRTDMDKKGCQSCDPVVQDPVDSGRSSSRLESTPKRALVR